jgi:sialidase-1
MSNPSNTPRKMEHIHIYGDRHEYCGWPAVTKAKNGDILVSFCRTDEHVGPSGAIWLVRSSDNGKTWSSPIVVRDSLLDDREEGITTLRDGRLIMHAWSTCHTEKSYADMDNFIYGPAVKEKWIQEVKGEEYRDAADLHGSWTLLSEDNGSTWNLMGRGPDSVHGGVHLASGDVLVASYRESGADIDIWSASEKDLKWEKRSVFESTGVVDQDSAVPGICFDEPHVAQLPTGRVILGLRATSVPYDDMGEKNLFHFAYSDDEGRTWSEVHKTEIWGYPPHLLTLSDGRLLCSYSYRREPYGERACISEDGITWKKENEIILRDDVDGIDLGYPHSIELEPGRILTVYYQSPRSDPPYKHWDTRNMQPPDPLRPKPAIWGTIWEI